MTRTTVSVAIAVVLILSSLTPVWGADSGTVPGTVTVEQAVACVLVEGGYAFGTQPFSLEEALPAPRASTTLATVSSCGEQDQDVFVRGTDAVGDQGAAWAISPTAASTPCEQDVFGVKVSETGSSTASAAVSFADTAFATVSPGTTVETAADLFMPCAGSTGIAETMTFSVVYTALVSEASDVPVISVSHTSLTFGAVEIGGLTNARLTIGNVGTAPLLITGIEINQAGSQDFLLGLSGCLSSIPPGGQCTVEVLFSPNLGGSRFGTLEISTNSGGEAHTTVVMLQGTAITGP